MKHFVILMFACVMAIFLAFEIDSTTRFKDLEGKLKVESSTKDLKIQELEKEIRLLKQDIRILENGIETEAREAQK